MDANIFDIARDRLPLPRLMAKIGDASFSKKNSDCPFCGTKGGKFGLFKDDHGRDRFKCHAPGCVANENVVGHNEVAYLSLRKNLSIQDASKEYLQLAVPDVLEAQKAERERDASKVVPVAPGPEGSLVVTPRPARPKKSPNVWDALWRKLVLNPSDRLKLRNHRGYSDETIYRLGFRSNNQSNRLHLDSLSKTFPMELLLTEGIFIQRGKKAPAPNPQFLGWGRTKRKDEKGEPIWDWTEPVLIPYLDDDGNAFYLRPHKGGVARRRDESEEDLGLNAEDDDESAECSSHVYCPFLLADLGGLLDGTLILTEGEFKAGALFQCRIPALAIPGITFVRNRAFRTELINLLRRFAINDLVIVFDNEQKDDPRYADRYKPDPWDRWDTPMWAEYMAIILQRELYAGRGSVRIGVIPDQFREEGKADFDSVLHSFVSREGEQEGVASARRTFHQIVTDASSQRQARELFPSESRRIIECKLQRLLYKALVPAGGDREQQLASRLRSIDAPLADAFRNTVGCYYERKMPSKDEKGGLIKQANKLSKDLEEAKEKGVNGSEIRRMRLNVTAAWERVKGIPEAISDFILHCDYKLHTATGRAERLIWIRNRSDSGKSNRKLIRLSGAQLSRAANFREACLDTGRAVWKGGDKVLQDLTEDMDHHSYHRDIFEVNYYGYHAESRIWFFGDCAFGPHGQLIEADLNNIFWSEGVGYQIDATIDERGTTFEQGAPLLMSPQDAKFQAFVTQDLFVTIGSDFYDTIGGYDAWLALGLIFAYGAAPELLKLGGHPSVWLYGKLSGGKTTIARWLMRIWGFKDLGGVGIDDRTTHVGMNRFLAQYSCLPVWFDEYRAANIDPQKEAVVRGAFDRNSGAKGMADNSNRTRSAKIHTTPIVTGESSSSDAATRSRYGHINVNDKRRLGDGQQRYVRMQSECRHYYLLGRYIMENREAYSKQLLDCLDKWMSNPAVRERISNERVRFVYGVAHSAFTSLGHLLGITSLEQEDEFRSYLLTHGEQALQDVISETFLSRFWADVVSGVQRGMIKKRFFSIRHVTRDEGGALKLADANTDQAMHVCYIAANPVFDDYASDLRRRSEDPPLDLGDLRREMAKEPYWIPLPKSVNNRTHRMSIEGSKMSCWVISLEKDNDSYVFPFAEDLVEILLKTKSESDNEF